MNSLNAKKTKVLFVGYAIPEELMSLWTANDMHPQVQSHQHQWSLIRGIEHASQSTIDLLSVAAISDWPRNSLWWVSCRKWSHASGASDVMVFFINILFLKQITRFTSIIYYLWRWLLSHRKTSNKVIFHYATQSSQLWALLFAIYIFPATTIVIMADPPSVRLAGESFVRRLARQLDRWMQLKALGKIDGLVVLAEALAKDFAPGVPFCVSEGIAPDLPILSQKRRGMPFVAMYAGSMSSDYGVRLILDCVPLLAPGIEIWLFGRGELLREAQETSNKFPALRVFGFCPRKEVVKKCAEASIMLNPRSTLAWFVKYSFPSKILEYMASGTPLLTTRLVSIPSEYESYVFWLDDESAKGLATRLMELRDLDENILPERGLRARTFVREKKSEFIQGIKIWSFTSDVIMNNKPQKAKADIV